MELYKYNYYSQIERLKDAKKVIYNNVIDPLREIVRCHERLNLMFNRKDNLLDAYKKTIYDPRIEEDYNNGYKKLDEIDKEIRELEKEAKEEMKKHLRDVVISLTAEISYAKLDENGNLDEFGEHGHGTHYQKWYKYNCLVKDFEILKSTLYKAWGKDCNYREHIYNNKQQEFINWALEQANKDKLYHPNIREIWLRLSRIDCPYRLEKWEQAEPLENLFPDIAELFTKEKQLK